MDFSFNSISCSVIWNVPSGLLSSTSLSLIRLTKYVNVLSPVCDRRTVTECVINTSILYVATSVQSDSSLTDKQPQILNCSKRRIKKASCLQERFKRLHLLFCKFVTLNFIFIYVKLFASICIKHSITEENRKTLFEFIIRLKHSRLGVKIKVVESFLKGLPSLWHQSQTDRNVFTFCCKYLIGHEIAQSLQLLSSHYE